MPDAPHVVGRAAAAEPFFKSWDDAAARLVRSVFLLSGGLLGIVFLPVFIQPVLTAASHPVSLSGFYQFATAMFSAIVLVGGSVGALMWGAIVLVGAINAAVLAGALAAPDTSNRIARFVFRLYSKERRYWSMVLPALSFGTVLMVLLAYGIVSSKELIQGVLRAIEVNP